MGSDAQQNLASDQDEIAKTLAEFNRACVTLAKMLEDGPSLYYLHRLTIENSIALVQHNYEYWVREFGTKPRPI
jgi:hypothetical protein